MRWLDGITNAMDMTLSKLLGIVKYREALHAAVRGSQKAEHDLVTEQTTISSVQLLSRVQLRPHELQHARPPGPSPAPGVHPDPHLSS